MLGSDTRRRPAWRDRWYAMAAVLAIAAFAASEAGASLPVDIAPEQTVVAALRLLTLLFALLGGAAVLRREAARRARWEREAAATRADWEERAHEARTALSTIELALFAAARRDPGGHRWQGLADVVRAEVAHLHRLLDGDDEPEAAVDFPVVAVVEAAAVAARLRGQRVDVTVPPSLAAHGRPGAVAEITANLLENAHRHAHGARVEIGARRRGGEIVLRIADDGPGVDAALREVAFARGVGRRGGGTGLGLYIARRLAAAESGALHLDNQAQGAAFVVTLPAARSKAVAYAA